MKKSALEAVTQATQSMGIPCPLTSQGYSASYWNYEPSYNTSSSTFVISDLTPLGETSHFALEAFAQTTHVQTNLNQQDAPSAETCHLLTLLKTAKPWSMWQESHATSGF